MSGSAQISAVLFDLDGTLIDSFPGIEFAVRRAVEACEAAIAVSDLRSLVGPPLREGLRRVSGRETAEELDQLERAFRASYDGGAWQMATLYPGVRETIGRLAAAGLQIFVVTNKPAIPAERALVHFGIWPLLAAMYAPGQREPEFKSKAEALLKLQEEWGLPVDRMLMVGDSLDDARAAAICGCQFAAVEFGYGNAASQTEYPIHCRLRAMGDLPAILFDRPISDRLMITHPPALP